MEGSMCKRKPAVVPLHLPSPKKCKCEEECISTCSKTAIAADPSIFDRSELPTCFMFYERGEWKDFLQKTSSALATAFQARHSSVKFTNLGNRYLLSFIRMLQLNLDTGFCRSIAWVDATGKRFTPQRCIEGYGVRQPDGNAGPYSRGPCMPERDVVVNSCRHEPSSNSRGTASRATTHPLGSLDIDMSEHSTTNTITQRSSLPNAEDIPNDDASSDSSSASSTIFSSDTTPDVTSSLQNSAVCDGAQRLQDFPLLHDKLIDLKPADLEFEEVKRRFLSGLSVLANHTTVTGISKNCHRTTSGHARYQAFKQQEALTKRLRGDANVRYAWYGTSKHGVSSIVLHGFGQPKTLRDGAMYGVGIYLAPEKHSNLSAVYSDVDNDGEHHVVLCRVIMGNMEQVARGSTQFHPGSEDHDGGIDNLSNPRQYVVWSTHMNTHILPEFIVSFKLAAPWKGVIAALRGRRKVGQSLHETSQHNRENDKVKDDKMISRVCNSPARSPWMSIDMLFLLLKSSLSAESMNTLQQHHLNLKEGRLSSSEFISCVRLIAGDNLVSNALKSMQTHVFGAVVLQNLLTSRRCQMADNRRIA
ncbi:hypothetical protein GOP47_0003039 [Adiantum capillus-veneris]|uniref:Poly [ADP-ribose] polymerase n=1 Tax=Adiantum capillus-veneris TaxID=13818 RepID=A0A9D4VB82_ADICA|nr:hypothetical protein GOP47_0003039 [Adiantum capillus-veneris]